MSELEELRRRKLEQMQGQVPQEEHIQQQVEQLEMIVKQKLTKEALERYGNLKSAHPQKAIEVLAVLGQAIQTGNVVSVDDNVLKNLLIKLEPEKKDIKITRR